MMGFQISKIRVFAGAGLFLWWGNAVVICEDRETERENLERESGGLFQEFKYWGPQF